MNFERAQLMIKKINDFLHSLEHDEAQVLPMERQLLLSYVDELRGSLTAPDVPVMAISSDLDPQLSSQNHGNKAAVIIEDHSTSALHTTGTNNHATPGKEMPQTESASSEPPSFSDSGATEVENSIWDELFALESAKDLSEKLSASKVESISTAMGINEKIYTINELFGGNDDLFSETCQELESLADFAAAKKYLSSTIAPQQEWHDPSKRDKVREFVRLVGRLYL